MNHTQRTLFILVTLLLATIARAQDIGDIVPILNAGTLTTNRYKDDLGSTEPARVFTTTLGEIGVPHFSSEPGYEAAAGNFVVGSRLGWRALAGLQVWNGVDFVPTTNTQVQLQYLTASFIVADQPVEGFSLLTQSDGGFHKHHNITLSSPSDTLNAGAYLLSLQLALTGPVSTNSEPYYLLLNESLTAAEFDVAVTAARARFEPALCFGDLDESGEVDLGDVAIALLDYGPCAQCPADLDGTDEVDFGDIALILLSNGPCL